LANEYAVYQGEELLVIGTAKECAAYLGIKPESVKWMTTPSAQKRIAQRKRPDKARTVIKIS
jgi:hypothetical protein